MIWPTPRLNRYLDYLSSGYLQSLSYLAITLSSRLGVCASPGVASAADLATLTTIRQILQLSRSEAVKNYPIRLRAEVTYYYGGTPPDLFLHDSTGGVWVNLSEGASTLASGDLIEIEGVSEQPD